jgi:hypothetical protein
MSHQGKTDNDHVPSKVLLRVEAITRLGEPREIHVLDAFHGHGRLWKLTEDALPDGWSVNLFRADKQARRSGTLRVDNARLLEALDLSRFDLIDLDAYGWPAAQLRSVAMRAPGKMVLTTRISRALGQMPKVILDDLGVKLPNAPSSLIVTLADELWEAWLYQLGYRQALGYRFDHGHHVKRYELLIP